MPIVKCKRPDGSSGYKVQNGNKCFKTKKQARMQLAAIKISQQKRGKSEFDTEDLNLIIQNTSEQEWISFFQEIGYTFSEQVMLLADIDQLKKDLL